VKGKNNPGIIQRKLQGILYCTADSCETSVDDDAGQP
jgi:hypothetical protein